MGGMAGRHGGAVMRAIDRYEGAICEVLECREAADYADALAAVAPRHGLSVDRLDHLVRVWCAIAGVS